MPPDSPKKVCFRTLTFHTLRSTMYVALPVRNSCNDLCTHMIYICVYIAGECMPICVTFQVTKCCEECFRSHFKL